MRKYTAAPKEIADAFRDSVPATEAEALGNDWKKLPSGQGTRIKAGKRLSTSLVRRAAMTKKKASAEATIKIKGGSVEVNFGGVRFKVQGTPSESYAKGLAKAVKDYIKAHPVRA
jgi:hypothetical protein